MQRLDATGTLRYYGTPAEEGGSGKVYMVRAGLFDDLDVAISWHAWDENTANPNTNLATIAAREEFDERRWPGFQYEALRGDRLPALDYRK